MGFIHDTDADPSETRAAKISAGLKKYIVSRANSEFSRVLASINRDRDQAKKTDHPKNEPATCCNPNLYDCHCPFPDDGLAVLASLPPVRVTPSVPPPPSSDRRCGAPPRTDPPLSSRGPVANCSPIPLVGGASFSSDALACL